MRTARRRRAEARRQRRSKFARDRFIVLKVNEDLWDRVDCCAEFDGKDLEWFARDAIMAATTATEEKIWETQVGVPD